MILEENSQGYFRVKLDNGQYMRDTDLMLSCTGSHVSKILTYTSKAAAYEGYAKHLHMREMLKASVVTGQGGAGGGYIFPEPMITEDFKPIT